MHNEYLSGKKILSADLTLLFQYHEFEVCHFIGLDLQSVDISNKKFVDCSFYDCNLSAAIIQGTLLRDVSFTRCKMLGLQFDTCNPFGLSCRFESCVLQHSSFFKTKIKRTLFAKCRLIETDFTRSDLSESVFENCDLAGAIFDQTNLEKADFRTSFNYLLDPENNRIKKAKFSRSGLDGLLFKYQIVIS